jgi:hypothetical protein
MKTSSTPFGRVYKRWPRQFAISRIPLEERPFVDLLRKHKPVNDGVRLFMQQYDDDNASFDIDIVARYCHNVGLHDLNIRTSGKGGIAWLDDRPIPEVAELSGSNVPVCHSNSPAVAGNVSNDGFAGQTPADLPNVVTDSDITDSCESRQLSSVPRLTREPRKYEECLTARELYWHLLERRFSHERLENADRRLIWIADPEPCHFLALTETTPEYLMNALQDELWQFLAFQTSLKVKIPPTAYPVFQLELHLPHLVLKPTPVEDLRKIGRNKDHRGWMDLSFLAEATEEGILGMYRAQFSLTICGTDNSRWVAYALEDTKFDPDRGPGEDEHTPDRRSDQISLGDLNADDVIWDAREYFLRICIFRIKHALRHTRHIVRAVEASHERFAYQSFSSASRDDIAATSDWTEAMPKLLDVLITDTSKKIASWTRLASADKDRGYFTDADSMRPDTILRVQSLLDSLDECIEDLKAIEKRLRHVEDRCEKLAHRLEFALARQGSRSGEFTIVIISPILIVTAFFAIPDPILSFRRDFLSFFISIGLVVLALQFTWLVRQGWFRRQRWYDKFMRRTNAMWHGDDSIVTTDEAGTKKLRRRPTHMDNLRCMDE